MHLFRRSKTCYFLITLLLCSVFFWISWQPLSSLTLEWYFKHKLERQLGGSLEIENVRWEKDRLLLDGPRLFSKDSSRDRQPKFYAKQIAIDYDLFFWQRKVLLKILLTEPTFSMESTAETLLKVAFHSKSKKRNLFSFDWELATLDGKIAESDQAPLPFVLEIANSPTSKGHFSIHFTPHSVNTLSNAPQLNSTLKGHIFTAPSGDHAVQLAFENTPLKNLITGFNAIEGPFKDLAISAGLINGLATVSFPKRGLPELQGELTFTDIDLKHAPLSFESKIPKAIFKRTSNASETPKTTLNLSDPFHLALRNQHVVSPSATFEMDITVKPINGVYEVEGQITSAEQDSLHLGFDLTHAFSLKNGWFKAENLPLKKFAAPFIFPDATFSLEGEADFKGTFNKDSVTIESQSKQLSLENAYFLIEMLPAKSDSTAKCQVAISGKHELNLLTGEMEGDFFLRCGSYLEKASQLLFTEICGKISEKNGSIQAKHLLGYCCGLYFNGAVQIEKEPVKSTHFDVRMNIESLIGTVSNLKQFLLHFPALESLRFDSLPLEGTFSLAKGPHQLFYNSSTHLLQVQDKLSGSLSEGRLDCSSEDFTVHELACDFTYDQQTKSLAFDNFQGTAFLGEAENADEYTLVGNLHFNNLFEQEAKFDFSFENNEQELLRLAGHTRLQSESNSERLLQIDFDKNVSRLMGSSSIDCKLTLAPTYHVDQFHMGFDLSFPQLKRHFKSLTKTKIWKDLGLSEEKLGLINTSTGSVHVDLSYHQKEGPFWFNLNGNHLMMGAQPIEKFLLRTKKQGNTWSVEQLQMDRLSISADLVKENRKWLFPFLGIRWGSSFLAGLKGEYQADKRIFSGNINLLEIDSFKQLVHEYQPLWFSFQAENADFSYGKLLVSDDQEGCSCTGQWQLNRAEADQPLFTFAGDITGHNVAINGYACEFLQTKCSYSFGNIQLRQVALQDPSGLAQIGQIDIIRNEKGIWQFSVEECEVTDWRPSLLRSVERSPATNNHAFIVKRLKMGQLQGQLGNPYSFTGQGELYFNNQPQQTPHPSLLAIPVELIDRIGLDPAILTPASGTIYFKVSESKFFPTKFKDVYSEGRLSQFNLASDTLPSFMDFNGNLNLNVRIKQYNLLFKLTELFTFNISGTLDKPHYSIDKNSKKNMSLLRKLKVQK